MKYDELVKEEENVRDEKNAVLELMMNNPNAGIGIEDTLESASKKIADYAAKHPEIAETLGSAETGYTMYDKYGNVIGGKAGVGSAASTTDIGSLLNGVYDYLEINPTKSVLDAVSNLPTAIRNDVISAYYLNEAFQKGEAEKPKNEVLSKIQAGNIDASVINDGYSAGLTLEEMKAAATTEEAKNKLSSAVQQVSTQGREQALYGAGKAVSDVASGVGQWFTQPHESIAEQLSNQFSQFVSPFLRGISGK